MRNNQFEKCLSFDDVLLKPQYSTIKTRKATDITTKLGRFPMGIPILASPMDTISSLDMIVKMCDIGSIGIIHRYLTTDEKIEMIAACWAHSKTSQPVVGVATGISKSYYEEIERLIQDGRASIINLDVAHGHHVMMQDCIRWIRTSLKSDIHIMAGAVATAEGFRDLEEWGANSIRCGVGSGSICSTRLQTGHGVPLFHTLQECTNVRDHATIIADGGIRNSGDIVKSLAIGADMVMVGSLFSGCLETPGEVMIQNGTKCKIYKGMASRSAKLAWKNDQTTPEGVSALVPLRGSVVSVVNELEGGIRSGLSYSGAASLRQLRDKAVFLLQTSAGLQESGTHIASRGTIIDG